MTKKVNQKIESSQVSVVVQGPVCGTTSKPNQYTKNLCESVRRFMPDAELIISTWESCDVGGLSYDKLVKTPDIGMTYCVRPGGEICPHTVNHEILTSRAGVMLAERRYVLRVRSDMYIKSSRVLSYVGRYNAVSGSKYRVARERIIVLPTYNYRRGKIIADYSVCDWVYLGLREDICDLFDIDLMDMNTLRFREGEKYPYLVDNFGAEQYIWTSYLKKKGIECTTGDAKIKFEKTIANNLVLLPAQRMKIDIQKAPHSGYAARPMFSQGLYTFCEWKRLYNRYGGGKELIKYNPIEDVAYNVIYGMRFCVMESYPELYGKIVGFIRKLRRRSFLRKWR